ncbi:hypothetical protein GCM10022393_36030 [Aquimarina addita]|uniref:Uncharacterized protein n=1 Tax=Aquimarina addita TaxID=870485 RepID=A0ABP6UQW8_9FLAO
MSDKKRWSFLLDDEESTPSSSIKVDDDAFFNPMQEMNKIRYRCEQKNTTHTDKSMVFHADMKKEYLTEFIKKDNTILVNSVLEDYVYKTEPKHFQIAMDSFRDLEFVKENVLLKLDTNGKIQSIQNLEAIQDAWTSFRKDVLQYSDFFVELKKVNEQAAQDIIDSGNAEFGKEENLIKTYDKNLFYHLILDTYLVDISNVAEHKKIKFLSQIFQNIEVEVDIVETTVSEDDDFIHRRKVGTLQREKLDRDELIRQYDQFYKPMVEYNFTEYEYMYRLSYVIDKKTGFISEGRAVFSEKVKNNYEFTTEFNLKQVQL